MDILSLLRNSPGAQAWLAQQAPMGGLAALGLSQPETLDREMSYDGSHPRQQEQAARDHFRSYGPNMLMDALIPGYGAGGDAKAASEAYGEGRYGAAALNAGMAAADFLPFLSVLPAAAKGIRAFHGSPHDFDRFDMSKIGTGEGAQAYGHGLYFAENEGVARGYKEALSGRWSNQEERRALLTGKDAVINAARMMFDDKMSPDEIRPILKKAYGVSDDVANAALHSANPGRMYEVNINADPEAFLDYDRDLLSQGPSAKAALERLGYKADPEGLRKYDDALLDALLGDGPAALPSQPRNPTGSDILTAVGESRLRDAGIPGIKYLDAGSRGAGDGSRNYVVFDDRLITILRKYGIGGLIAGGGAYALTDAEYAQAAELLAQDGMNTGAQ